MSGTGSASAGRPGTGMVLRDLALAKDAQCSPGRLVEDPE